MISCGKWAPLKLTAIVSLPRSCSHESWGEIIPQIISKENLRQNHTERQQPITMKTFHFVIVAVLMGFTELSDSVYRYTQSDHFFKCSSFGVLPMNHPVDYLCTTMTVNIIVEKAKAVLHADNAGLLFIDREI